MEEYKYTCEPGASKWTPMNSNLCMQGIKVLVLKTNIWFKEADFPWSR